MPRKRSVKNQPAALSLTLMVDGKVMVAVQQDEKVPMTQEKFTARAMVHSGARPSACALTLVETARFLMMKHPFYDELFKELISRLTLADTTWGTWLEEIDMKKRDLPF